MLSSEKKVIFDQFSRCEMSWHRAVRTGKFENYSVFLDEYFAAGYKYPLPNEEMQQRDTEAFDSFIKAAAEHDRRWMRKRSSNRGCIRNDASRRHLTRQEMIPKEVSLAMPENAS